MIQLAYDTAYDPYHTAFRMLRLCVYSTKTVFQIPKLRILDFYLNFPHLLKQFLGDTGYKLPKGGKSTLKKMDFTKFPEPYSELPSDKTIFYQMEVIQAAAIQTMCLRGFIDVEAFRKGNVQIIPQRIPSDLLTAVQNRNSQQDELLDFLVNFMGEIELDGAKGLKAHTHLLEYRYDAV